MTHTLLAGLALCFCAGAGSAADVAPDNVSFEDGAVSASLNGVSGNSAAGREIVGDKSVGNCISCHQISDLAEVPFQGTIAPILDGAGDRWNEAQLRGIVANAKMMFPETMMPAFYKTSGFIRPGDGFTGKAPEGDLDPILSAQQIEDVVAYLVTLK